MQCDKINNNSFKATMKLKGFEPRSKEALRWNHIAELFEGESALYPYDSLEMSKKHGSLFGSYKIGNVSYGIGILNYDLRRSKNDYKNFCRKSDSKIAKALSKMLEIIKKEIRLEEQLTPIVNQIAKVFLPENRPDAKTQITRLIDSDISDRIYDIKKKDDSLKYIFYYGKKR